MSFPLACSLYLLLLSHISGTAGCCSDSYCCKPNEYYSIKNQPSGLALDAGNGTGSRLVRIQRYNASPLQQWSFEDGSNPGLFYIVNRATRQVLDVALQQQQQGQQQQLNRIVVNARSNSLAQQWNIQLGGIVANAQYQRLLDVVAANYTPGNVLQVWDSNGTGAQKFLLQRV